MNSVRIMQVIETRSCKGKGTIEDPCRLLIQYWDFEGNLLAENDTPNKQLLLNRLREEVKI